MLLLAQIFLTKPVLAVSSCNVSFQEKDRNVTIGGDFKPDTSFRVLVSVPGKSGGASETYSAKGFDSRNGEIFPLQPFQRLEGSGFVRFGPFNTDARIGTLAPGNYYVYAYEKAGSSGATEQLCGTASFTVVAPATSNPNTSGGTTSQTQPTSTCRDGSPGVETGIGCIKADLASFVNTIFGFVLGFAGALAILLIIVGGFKVATSQGNPDSLQDGKDTITHAILGLVFILLATSILAIIGIDILGLSNVFQRGPGGSVIVK